MNEPKYPRWCREFGHDHSGVSGPGIWSVHTEQCKRYYWGLPFKRCEHIQTLEEAIEEAGGLKDPPPPPPPAPPKEVHVYHHNIQKGDTVYITISGTADRKPMRVANVTKKGEADDLELEEV